jgi:ADP-ribosylglycohydrolase
VTARDTANELLERGVMRAASGDWLHRAIDPQPRDWSRIEGMLLGLAVGDALGNTTEGRGPDERQAAYGEIREYLPNGRERGRVIGLPSDDTQLAFWTLEHLLDGPFEPAHLAQRLAAGSVIGIGRTVQQFQWKLRGGAHWTAAGGRSAANGAIMRIAPMLVPHAAQPSNALWAETALSAMVTHNDSAAIASCVAFVSMLWDLSAMDTPPPPAWWADTFVARAREVETDERYSARFGSRAGWTGSLSAFVEACVPAALASGASVREACDTWGSGAYLLETLPSVVFILARHASDPEEAIVRAVNDTVDNDTIAAIVGAAVGALHGREALPERWIAGLSGRTGDADDGQVFALIEQARRRCAGERTPRPAQ